MQKKKKTEAKLRQNAINNKRTKWEEEEEWDVSQESVRQRERHPRTRMHLDLK